VSLPPDAALPPERHPAPTPPCTDAALPAEPMALLIAWLDRARRAGIVEHRAMCWPPPTSRAPRRPETVLATVIDDAGVVFNSSHPSRKTLDLAANPKASAVFGWYGIGRQVVLSGAVDPLPDAEVDAAFAARARLRLLAWAYHRAVRAETRRCARRGATALAGPSAGAATELAGLPAAPGRGRLLVRRGGGRRGHRGGSLQRTDGGWRISRVLP